MVINASFALFVCLLGLIAFFADRFDKPSIPIYLALGILFGPIWSVLSASALVPEISLTGGILSLVSELGLLFLLFIVGLQVKLSQISGKLKTGSFMTMVQGLGVAALASIYLYIAGFEFLEILILSAALVPSSAAIVIPMLKQQQELSSENGKLDISVLVPENIYLVVAVGAVSALSKGSGLAVVRVLAAMSLGLIIAYISSRLVLPKIVSEVLQDQKSFLMAGFGLLGAFVLFSSFAGLKPEIGAFFAGVALAQLPYSSELQAAVDPMTEFFLAIFLASLGLTLSPSSVSSVATDAVILSLVLVPAKAFLYFISSRFCGEGGYVSLRSALDLSQVPDVSIVVVTVAASSGLLGGESVALITLVVILTMAASSILISSGNLLASKFFNKPSYSREDTDAILLGSSENADTVFNILKSFYNDVIVVNRGTGTPDNVSMDDTVYGDFSHEEIRQKAGSESAETIATLKDDVDVEEEVIEDFPSKNLILLEKSPQLSLKFLDASADYVVNPELLAANELVERVEND